LFTPVYVRELCNRALTSLDDEITIYVDDYDVVADPRTPVRTRVVRCRGDGGRDR
jgi:hypothetical protein